MQFDSPRDSDQTAEATPVDSPARPLPWNMLYPVPDYLALDQTVWTVQNWQHYWGHNPIRQDHSQPLRRDVYMAMLLLMEAYFDRNMDNMVKLEERAPSSFRRTGSDAPGV